MFWPKTGENLQFIGIVVASETFAERMKTKTKSSPAVKRDKPNNSTWVKWLKHVPPVKSNHVTGALNLEMSVVEWSMLTAIAARRGLTVDTAARDLVARNLYGDFDKLQ